MPKSATKRSLTKQSNTSSTRIPPKATINNTGVRLDVRDRELLLRMCGTKDIDLSTHLISQISNSAWLSDETKEQTINASIAILHGISPRDEIEAMLSVQMIAVHNMSMECARRAMFQSQTDYGVEANASRAHKLMRTFTQQVETLNRYRGKGQQKVTVEHVHVNEGGQAIVGDIKAGGGGNG